MKLICGIHNHALAKSLVEHPYDENIIIGDMTKSMIKPRNILLTLKEHNYIHWHGLKDKDVVRDIFWNSTYKKNRYRLSLLDIVGVTPTGMTFSAAFSYLEGERVNNVV
ncbi:hypothetical protein GmHk_18G051829 [Glycine max]|nr:hypothetical protein GmHk_18G051829 [Glycine max]